MTSKAEDVPSCSKMNTFVSSEETQVGEISKYPVVMLTKLDPDIVSVKVSMGDAPNGNLSSLSRTPVKKPETKNSFVYDEDATLSDVSVSFSEEEEMASDELGSNSSFKKGGKVNTKKNIPLEKKRESDTGKKKNISSDKREASVVVRENKNTSISSSQKNDARGKDIKKESSTGGNSGHPLPKASPRNDRHRAPKHQNESAEMDSSKFKKCKPEDIVEKITQHPKQMNKEDKIHNNNARYKLSLGPFSNTALESESFRKFINLAADCVISFNKKKTAATSDSGNLTLFFGDFLTLQSAMQRLSQLTVITSKTCVKGSITCMELKPSGKDKSKDQWKANVTAKLFFQFSAEKREKLLQLISSKGRKKEDTKRKCVQLHRIPSSINEDMLYLLFPFSVGVKISNTDLTVKDIKGPVEIEYESQDWMEAVLVCFKDFSVSTSGTSDKTFNLYIKNFIQQKEEKSTTSTSEKQVTGSNTKGSENQRDKSLNQSRDLSKTKNLRSVRGLKTVRDSNPSLLGKPSLLTQRTQLDKRGLIQNSVRNVQRKRPYPGTSFGQRIMDVRELAVKQRRLENAEHARADRMRNDLQQSQHTAQHDADQDSIRQLALARGLDPSNPGVLRILEMSAHLEQLQGLAIQQNAEAKSLGIVGLAGQQVVNEHQLHLQQQALARKQAQEDAEVRRFQAAVQAQNLHARGFGDDEQAGSVWQNLEMSRRLEEEERRQQEQYLAERAEINRREQIAGRLKQMEEMELISRQGAAFQREGHRSDTDQRLARNYFANSLGDAESEFTPPTKIQAFGHAPATSGLLGAGPPINVHSAASIPSFAAAKLAEQQKADNLFIARDEPGFSRDRLQNNLQRNLSARQQNVSQQQPSNRPTPRFKAKLSQKPPQSNQTFRDRSQDARSSNNRKPQGTSEQRRTSGRQSRWNTDEDTVDPDRNDTPLEFNRPRSGLTTEQAFKQDIERTRAVLGSHGEVAPSRFKPQPLMQITKPLMEEAKDRHGLPIQFGKNAVKRVPTDFNDERRRNDLNTRVENFAASVHAVNPRNVGATAFKSTQDKKMREMGPRGEINIQEFEDTYGANNAGDRREMSLGGRAFRQANEIGLNLRGDLAIEATRRDVANVRASRGELMAQRDGAAFPRGGIRTQDVHRDRQLSKDQIPGLRLSQTQDQVEMDVFEFENQYRRNDQDTHRGNGMMLNRGRGGHARQGIKERDAYFEHRQEDHQAQGLLPSPDDYGHHEWEKPGGHFAEKASGHRAAQEYNRQHDAMLTGLHSQKSLIYNEEHFESKFGQAGTGGRSFENRNAQKFTRGEEQQNVDYEDPDIYTGETGFGGYQVGGNFGAPGRGGRMSQTRGSRGRMLSGGHGNVGEQVQGLRRNIDQGRGLLELPEKFKQQEDAYYAEDESHFGAEAEEFGHYQKQQSFGRTNRMQPPPPPLLGHGVNFY